MMEKNKYFKILKTMILIYENYGYPKISHYHEKWEEFWEEMYSSFRIHNSQYSKADSILFFFAVNRIIKDHDLTYGEIMDVWKTSSLSISIPSKDHIKTLRAMINVAENKPQYSTNISHFFGGVRFELGGKVMDQEIKNVVEVNPTVVKYGLMP